MHGMERAQSPPAAPGAGATLPAPLLDRTLPVPDVVRRPELTAAKPAAPKPVVLLILDGWGHREDPADNALAQAELPNWRRLLATAPHTLIHTEGRHVGLPDGQMGNSEVGHMNLGAGRIVYQDLTRIDAAIEDGSFFDNVELRAACEAEIGRAHV